MIRALKEWKIRRQAKQILLVCAGSGRGRVPFAMVSRDSARFATREVRWLSFVAPTNEDVVWSFRILARDEEAARRLETALKKKEVYSLSPDDFGIQTIVIRRNDWGSEPRWIGG